MTSNWSLNEFGDQIVYGSVINRIGQTVCESENLYDFIKKALSILFYTPVTMFLCALFILYHCSMILTGNINK